MTGEQLRALRKCLGLSQRELAVALGYKDVMSISRMERDDTPIARVVELAIQHLSCARPSDHP